MSFSCAHVQLTFWPFYFGNYIIMVYTPQSDSKWWHRAQCLTLLNTANSISSHLRSDSGISVQDTIPKLLK